MASQTRPAQTRPANQAGALALMPPTENFDFGSITLALLAHICLLVALTWGTAWRDRPPVPIMVSAELWSNLPIEAAAPAAPTSPPDSAQPTPAETPATPPEPPEPLNPALNPNPKPSPKPSEATPKPSIQIDKSTAVKKTDKENPKNKELQQQQLKQQQKQDQQAKRRQEQSEKQREQSRIEQVNRLTQLAGSKGETASQSQAQQSAAASAPSSTYIGRVVAKIRPNIVFSGSDTLQGNPSAEVDIRLASDGTILQPIRLSKSSGNKAWDAAVLRALEKTETLPRDFDGKVPSSMTIILRPQP
jgi:colicin import membrane protein